jgi:hypothetical protein
MRPEVFRSPWRGVATTDAAHAAVGKSGKAARTGSFDRKGVRATDGKDERWS